MQVNSICLFNSKDNEDIFSDVVKDQSTSEISPVDTQIPIIKEEPKEVATDPVVITLDPPISSLIIETPEQPTIEVKEAPVAVPVEEESMQVPSIAPEVSEKIPEESVVENSLKESNPLFDSSEIVFQEVSSSNSSRKNSIDEVSKV